MIDKKFDMCHLFDGAGHILNKGVEQGWFTGWQYAANQNGCTLSAAGGHCASLKDHPELARPVNNKTVFDAASVTKSLPVTLILLHLVSEGKIGLDDSVKDYVPRLKFEAGDVVTIRDLMSFGVTFDLAHLREYSKLAPEKIHQDIVTARLWRTGFKYSNYAPYLLRIVIEKLTGESLSALTYRDLIKPLGISEVATFHPQGSNIAATELVDGVPLVGVTHDPLVRALKSVDTGVAGLFASARGLCGLMAVVRDGKVAGKQYIKPELLDMVGQNQLTGAIESGLGFGLVRQLMHGFNPPHTIERYPDLFNGAIFRSGYTGCAVFYVPSADLTLAMCTNVLHPNDFGRVYMSKLRHVFLSYFFGGTRDLHELFSIGHELQLRQAE